ncbi:hypothetical protein, partial [Halobacillus sp. BBL2006]|uniref:hypothetical protein n=1 Tax=Halobacillus sp. BBL2006 TaxID=1543706 RepID=UPI0005440EE6
MATYRPVKKWFVPLLAVLLGLWLGFSVFPSQQEYQYNTWGEELDQLKTKSYQVETEYKIDGELASHSEGYWSKERSHFQVRTPVSDDTMFHFDIYFEGDYFYVKAGDDWQQGEAPHRVLEEIAPLDDFFTWSKSLLEEADEVRKTDNGASTTYTASFDSFDQFDFRGTTLEKQADTTLVMNLEDDQLQSIIFEVQPERPDD